MNIRVMMSVGASSHLYAGQNPTGLYSCGKADCLNFVLGTPGNMDPAELEYDERYKATELLGSAALNN